MSDLASPRNDSLGETKGAQVKTKDAQSKSTEVKAQKSKNLSAKEQKKLQKQAQRAAKKEQMNAAGGGLSSSASTPIAATAGLANSTNTSPGSTQVSSLPPNAMVTSSNGYSRNNSRLTAPEHIVLNLFSGIDPPKAIVSKPNVHLSILDLAFQMQNCRIIGSSKRCRMMMQAFMQVIRDYKTPTNSTLSRSLAVHLSHQIEVLKSGRGLSVSMGNSIRWLKQETSELSIDLPDEESKEHLINLIEVFIRDRLDLAAKIIVDHASNHVRSSGDVILTYGHSQVVIDTLIQSFVKESKQFSVIVADSPPLFEGKQTAATLAAAGVPTTYILMSALPYVMKGVTTLMVGAHGMVSNGNLYSRVGTSMVAVMASARSIPVLVLCETIKFSDRVQLDAFTTNEFLPGTDASAGTNSVFYDLTDQRLISKVITEVGALPASSVPVILREYKQVL